MTAQYNCISHFIFYFRPFITYNPLRVSILTYIAGLEICPILLLEIMIVHSHLYLTLLLLIACFVIHMLSVVENFMRCILVCWIVVT